MSKRDISIDALRGIAVFLMIGSHTVWMLTSDTDVFWHWFRLAGDHLAYIIFLFVFGISAYFSYCHKELTSSQAVTKLWHQILKLLIVYYAIAFASVAVEMKQEITLKAILEVFLLLKVPGFTEFMISFVVFKILFFPFRHQIKCILENRYAVVIIATISLVFFTIGHFIERHTVQGSLAIPYEAYTALFTSYSGYLRFPVFQYMPVFLLGLLFGHRYISESKDIRPFVYYMLLSLFLTTIALFSIGEFISFDGIFASIKPYLFTYQRWPNSLLFLSFGLFICFVFYVLLSRLRVNQFKKSLAFLGKHSISILLFHIIVIRIAQLFDLKISDNFIIILLCFIILLLGGPLTDICLKKITKKIITKE